LPFHIMTGPASSSQENKLSEHHFLTHIYHFDNSREWILFLFCSLLWDSIIILPGNPVVLSDIGDQDQASSLPWHHQSNLQGDTWTSHVGQKQHKEYHNMQTLKYQASSLPQHHQSNLQGDTWTSHVRQKATQGV
jgi:hypothetical protein